MICDGCEHHKVEFIPTDRGYRPRCYYCETDRDESECEMEEEEQ